MATLTKFTISPSGALVYKKTGALAPSNYIFRKNTVYKVGDDGVRRRVGSLSRKLTKAEASRIAKAEARRNRKARQPQRTAKPSKQKPSRPSRAKPAQPSSGMAYEEAEEFEGEDFPEPTEAIKEEFAERVRQCAASIAPQSLQAKIRALSTEAIWKGYQEDAYIFELYFRYHSPYDAPHKSDASVWLYQFVNRIEQYMDVSE